MLTANWDYDKKGEVRCYCTNGGRTYMQEVCIESGSPGKWKTLVLLSLEAEPATMQEPCQLSRG